MLLYAVRGIESKEPVGFYFVRRFDELSMMVDGVTNPSECECLAVHEPGAITWPGEIDWTMGDAHPRGQEIDFTEGLQFSSDGPHDGILDVLMGRNIGPHRLWKPVCA